MATFLEPSCLDTVTIEVHDETTRRCVERYDSFNLFFRNHITQAMAIFMDDDYDESLYSLQCDFMESPTAPSSVKWFPNESEFYQMLVISMLNNVLKQHRIDEHTYGSFAGEDYDNPMKLVVMDGSNGEEILKMVDWFFSNSRAEKVLYDWISGVGNDLMKRYGYYSNGSHFRLYVFRV